MAHLVPFTQPGYIQDKFKVNDLLFNIGLRIDNYDVINRY